MTPLRAWWAALSRSARCGLGQHEHAADLSVAGLSRLRCLHCGRTSAGIAIDAPRYTYSAGMEQPDKKLRLHNLRLKRCPCTACEEARAARRQRRTKVTTMRRTA